MRNNEQAVKAAKEVLLIAGTMLGAVLLIMLVGFAIIGTVSVAMSLGTVGLCGLATTLVIYCTMKLLTRRYRMLVWHGAWLILTAQASLALIGTGYVFAVLAGMLVGVIASSLLGIRTTQRCADKALGDEFASYQDASGRSYKALDLDISDLPGGSAAARTMSLIIVGFLLALAIMAWGTFLNLFGVAPVLKGLWAVIFGAAAGSSFLTMVIVVVWIEQRFEAHVFMQPLPSEATRQLIEREVGRRPGIRNAVSSFFGDLGTMAKDLYSVSVRR